MALQSMGQFSRFGTLKPLLQRFAFVSLIVATFALMLIGKADTVLVERARTAVTDAVAPILRLMSEPAAAIANAVDDIRELAAIRRENTTLRVDNARLLQWQSAAQKLESENRNLRALLAFVPEPSARFVTARVVADTGGAFAQSLIVMAGGNDGVTKGHIVMSGEGLVGRVMQAGVHSSRVLLITDINSRIPVLVSDSGTRAILAGDNHSRPRLLYVGSKSVVAPGDKVVTSGDAKAFPVGLPIGKVASIDEGVIEVEPNMTRNRLLYVRVIDSGLEGALIGVPRKHLPTKPKPQAAPAESTAEETRAEAAKARE